MKRTILFLCLSCICTQPLVAMKRRAPLSSSSSSTSTTSSSKKAKTSLDELRTDYQAYLNGSPTNNQVKQLLVQFFREIIVAIKLLSEQETKEQGINNLQQLWNMLYEEKVCAGTLLNIVQQFLASLNTFINSNDGKKQLEDNLKVVIPGLITAKPTLDAIFDDSEKFIKDINALIAQLNEIIKKLPLFSTTTSTSSSSSSTTTTNFISTLPLPSQLIQKPSAYIQQFTQVGSALNSITNTKFGAFLGSMIVGLDSVNKSVCEKITTQLNKLMEKFKTFITTHQATLADKSFCLKDELSKIDAHTPEEQQTPFVQFLHKIKSIAGIVSALQSNDIPKLVQQFFNKLPALNQDQLSIALKVMNMAITVAERL
jgi:hypothetical protein